MSSNDRGDESPVTNPAAPQPRPGRPAATAQRAKKAAAPRADPRPDPPTESASPVLGERATGSRRPPHRGLATSVLDPSLDNMLDPTNEIPIGANGLARLGPTPKPGTSEPVVSREAGDGSNDTNANGNMTNGKTATRKSPRRVVAKIDAEPTAGAAESSVLPVEPVSAVVADDAADNVIALDTASAPWSRLVRRFKPAATIAVPVTGLAPPMVGPGPELSPPSVAPTSPITSPIPVVQAATPVTEPSVAYADPLLMPRPEALMPDQPPYVMPMPSVFDGGLFHTGPVPLDPSLDPDVPRREPRLKSVHVVPARRRGRPRMRRVTRVVRHVDPWSVFKVALCFSLVLYGVCLTAAVLLWNVAYTTGTIDNVQRFFESFGWDTFRFKGGELFHNAWIAGLFGAIGLTGLIVLAATLFNLITDLVGGIRVTVLEEEVVERDPADRRSFLRRRSRHTSSTVPAHPRSRDEDSLDPADGLG